MPLTALDPRTALVLIDLQCGITSLVHPTLLAEPVTRAAELAARFRAHRLPVVTKHQPGAFYGTDLDLQLRRRGITGIVLGGVATSMGVESTGRAGYDHGYNMTFAADAMTDPDASAHEHSVRVGFPKFGEVDTAAAIAAALTPAT